MNKTFLLFCLLCFVTHELRLVLSQFISITCWITTATTVAATMRLAHAAGISTFVTGEQLLFIILKYIAVVNCT